MTMKSQSDEVHFERGLAAEAHGVDLTVDVKADLERLQVPVELLAQVRNFIEEGLNSQGYIGYTDRLEQVRKMLAAENLQRLVSSTNEQLLAVLRSHRKLAPYEQGFEEQRY